MNNREELRIRILDAAAELFDSKGIKFTMDDLAGMLGMSKKTIYVVFPDKRSIMLDTIDRFFHDAMVEEEKIVSDDTLSTADKLRKVLGAVPERYAEVDLSKLYVLKEKYPVVYKHWQRRREQYWSVAIDLLAKGIAEGTIRPLLAPVFRSMFQATIEQFFQNDVLVKNHISYHDALREVAHIMVDGITIKE